MADISVTPNIRVLKILKSENLPVPNERISNYIYFVYDKMRLILYQSRYTDPFCVVDTLPDISVMVTNMLYITLEGKMYTLNSESIIYLGEIEHKGGIIDPDQVAILRSVGTIYFMNAESRYLDMQTRTLQLPYQNGSYQLSLSLAKDILIDKDTVIGFNPNSNQFEILGTKIYPDRWLEDLYKYRTHWTSSVDTIIEEGNNVIRANVNVSNDANNGVEIMPGGLFVNVSEYASKDDYENLVWAFYSYKNIIDSYVIQLRNAVMEVIASVSDQTINEKIDEALENYKPTISQMFDNYDDIVSRLNTLEDEVYIQVQDQIDDTKDEIIDYIDQMSQAWDTFEPDLDEPVYGYDYSGNI